MSLSLKPTHAAVKNYYAALHQVGQLHFNNEAQVGDAFAKLLADCGRKIHLTFIPQFPIQRARNRVVVDGALLDTFHLAHGYWEAKDEKDDLDREIKAKLARGYPTDNIIFQAPERAVLYQAGARVADEDISKADYLAQLVNHFFDYKAPHIEEWEQAVSEFSERIPELAAAVKKIIDTERKHSPSFVRSFEDFYALCRQAINPNLSEEAVERMLIQHLLTERIFERIFDNPDFTRRNVVAAEIEKVIIELTKRAFNRNEFLRPLDRFYKAIEVSAENTTGFSEKQAFLNKVYERFFQGYSPKEADTHGIVYTPQPIVNFMVRSVQEILQKEFGRSLGDKGVHILDPFVGTGNFIVRIMQEINATDLQYKYENELHCNEVMLLPYYIASMNIEHKYFERVGEYRAFPGICLVDTFDMRAQSTFFTEANTDRIEKQRLQTIFVVIGNPPYNAWQVDENDNNKNRKYDALDNRISETYAKSSRATNKNALSDPYIKAIRWASDRIADEGIVAYVTNNGFIDGVAADGLRMHLAREFDSIYILDLGGNVRKNPKLSGTTHNVFGIQVGVSINLFVRRRVSQQDRRCEIFYARADEDWTRWKKCDWLETLGDRSTVEWQAQRPDEHNNWLTTEAIDPQSSLPVAGTNGIFTSNSNGLKTNRDAWMYNFGGDCLTANVSTTIETYNSDLARWKRHKPEAEDADSFLTNDPTKISWSETLKKKVQREIELEAVSPLKFRWALYRPFTLMHVYFDSELNERRYGLPSILPNSATEEENQLIVLSNIGSRSPFSVLATNRIPEMHLCASTDGFLSFPFYTYAEDGTHRRENITDCALEQFRSHYSHSSIDKWDIFHYIYAILHHPEYRNRYAANLRRELPRIPFASAPSGVQDLEAFYSFVEAGERLAEIHVEYEKQPEYQLTKTEKAGEKLDYRVAKMKLGKDKTSLIYNQFLTLSGIPKETYEYRLGNRSTLEWVIDQYQVSTDARSGITNDPNRDDDPQYILRLIGQVITVSLETVKIVRRLPPLGLP
jgi:predicted helicase